MSKVQIAGPKFLPLFTETRLPIIRTPTGQQTKGRFDVFTRTVIDGNGKLVPPIRVIDAGHLRTRYYVYYGGRAAAKCLGRGTEVRMDDGTLRNVEDVRVNDTLRGVRGEARRVLSTTKGVAPLFRVIQSHGAPYVVNGDHLLVVLHRGRRLLIEARTLAGRPTPYYGFRETEQGPVFSNIRVTSIAPGEYFGFELDGDHLFMLADGTVTHNSHQFAIAAVVRARRQKTKFLCCREIMSTMADSVMSLLKIKIHQLGMENDFEVLTNEIRCLPTGSAFSFRGLRHNINELKSFEDADVCWVEEAADVTEESWDKLDPTIRKPGAEIWVGFNTELEDDPTYVRFVKGKDEDMTVVKVGYEDNPLLDPMIVKQAKKMKVANPEKFRHIYGGEPRRTREGGVFVPEMLTVIDAVPAGTTWARGWDLAGTAVNPKKPGKDPDWTVGMILGRAPNGRFIIGAPARGRGKPEYVEALLRSTMAADGWTVEQSIPQEPGQAGKFQVSYYVKVFAGYRLHFSTETGSKETRAGPFAAQVNAGNVDMVRGDWNRVLIDEMTAFSGDDGIGHDDMIDGLSRAFPRVLMGREHQRVAIRGL